MKTTIIAEAGVNHNGRVNIAKKMIKKAAEAGADFIKFQIYDTDSLVTKDARKANYQKKNSNKNENQYTMLKRYELNFSSNTYSQIFNHKLFLKDKFPLENEDTAKQ